MAIVEIKIEDCDTGEYVLFPGCCYNGNRFRALKKVYPPMFDPEDFNIDTETAITDVPRLKPDGSGYIEVTTGDVSVPCVAVFIPAKNQAVLVHTVQSLRGRNIGLGYERGKVTLSYPARRFVKYVWPRMRPNNELWEDIEVEIPYKVLTQECDSMEAFYEFFYRNRKIMSLNDSLPRVPKREEQISVHLEKYNALNWYEEQGFYGSDVDGGGRIAWSTGWIGGGISSYPMMKLGGDLEYERGIRTLEYLFKLQGLSGLFAAQTTADGHIVHDGFGAEGTQGFTLVRRSADVLYYLFKHFSLIDEIPGQFVEGARRCADAFVTLFETYGQLGQFADFDTGEIRVGGSAAGTLAPAGLVDAYLFFGDSHYLQTAENIGQYFREQFLKKGYTTGGPAEILQCPDSESAFALLESYVRLYDATRNREWLNSAEFAAHLCSTWVVPYNYEFPEGSEFRRLDMKSVGTVFANIQNKHSAPGICTLSGSSLHELYEFTGNPRYLELYTELTSTVGQYMSTEQRPIFSWTVPKDSTVHGSNDIEVPPEKLPPGYICERVNMSDWETQKCVGGVFNGSCWSEVSNMLILADPNG